MTVHPAHRTVHEAGSRPDIRVPFTEVTLEDSPGTHGSEPNPPFRRYHTAGPGSDPHTGLPPLRAAWVAERGDVEEYAGRVRDLTAGLCSLGVAKGDPVALMLVNRPEFHLVDAAALHAGGGVIVNIDYPLGLAAYNILREIAIDVSDLRGVYVLGKAATLNADVGDVMISSVIHDEHSGSTYWLDNAFSVDDIAPYLMFGSGLDNQRAVTV
nr:hypothetical protein [Actinomycetota bacterium]